MGEHTVVVDGAHVATCSCLADAVLMWAVTHSVLAQPIRVAYRGPLIFIQLNALGIMETPSVPSAVRKQMLFMGRPLSGSEQFGVVAVRPQIWIGGLGCCLRSQISSRPRDHSDVLWWRCALRVVVICCSGVLSGL